MHFNTRYCIDVMHEDEGSEVDVEEIQRINNTENDIQEAVTNVMLEYSKGIYC